MKLSKKNIILLLLSAFLVGIIGSYLSTMLIESKIQKTSTQDVSVNKEGKPIEGMDKVEQAFNMIEQHYIEEVDGNKLIEGAIHGMLNTLEDPYSTYMDEEAMNNFNEQIESSFQGIGAEVSMVDGKVTVVAPIKDSPAEKGGIKPNDQILKVDNEELEGLDLNQAVEKIRGKKGSKVTLSVLRAGETNFELELIRDDIPVETVYASMEEVDGKKTGIIQITSFSEETAKDFLKELSKLEEDSIDGLIIDVRGNPGGLLDSVEIMLKEFITKDTPYLQIENQQGEKELFKSELEDKKGYPISVLIDEGSASASEILAVAMKEVGYDVVGTKSFGKGTVQQAVPLGENGMVKLTFFKWLSPKGNWIHEKGIEPTKTVKQPDYYYTHPIQVKDPFKEDQSDDNIKVAQIMLKGLNYNIDRDDGYFDKQTKVAIEKFQKDEKIKITGELTKETANKIEVKIIEKIRSGKTDKQKSEALKELYK